MRYYNYRDTDSNGVDTNNLINTNSNNYPNNMNYDEKQFYEDLLMEQQEQM